MKASLTHEYIEISQELLIMQKFVFALLAALLFLPSPLPAAPPAQSGGGQVTMDFNDVDINVFIKYISELTGTNFVVDREVRGRVSIISPSGVSTDEAYRIFESVLEVNGYAAVPSGSVVKIVPSLQARAKNVATVRSGALSPEDRIITRIVQLNYAGAEEVRAMLSPLVPKTAVMVAHADSGIITITDYQSNIARLLEIIRSVDVPAKNEELVIIPLQHASATSAAKVVDQLFSGNAKQGKLSSPIRILPYDRANALVVSAPPAQLDRIRAAVKKLDVDAGTRPEQVQVLPLQHARAEELAKVLMDLPREEAAASGAADADKNLRRPVLTRDINIVADTETNALVINGPREEFEAVAAIVRQLDVPRRMIYLEALIMEVQADKDFNIGVQWGGAGTFADKKGRLYTGFSGNADKPYDIINGMNAGKATLPAGFTLGVLKEGIEIGGITFPNLGAVLNAYKNDEDINIIATPQILATDNKKAAIKVGENVPYIVSKNTTEAQRDYTNYEYKDVATTLEITPQINQTDAVRMDIGVQVIKLKELNNGNPTTTTRTADTTVVVQNEQTVVIGGMIGQDSSNGEYKVPGLGDIPILGWLFKSRGKAEKKTNLFIFITPHILQSAEEAERVFAEKRAQAEEAHREPGDAADRFLRRRPAGTDASVLADLGAAKLREGRLAMARRYLLAALEADGDNLAALVHLGLLLEQEDRRQEALARFEQALALPLPEAAAEGPAVQTALELRNAAALHLKGLQARRSR
ncbi:type II secretion system protein GspD [Desulfobulbus oralis]|uniref:Type II secretion system protein GspD n=2 Tax=Desulfobulbus oralis TaxID=1986146 RepID=A0A2L1GNG2_9BACT|nr:type II secretion system protein GspD [Desulfobulbus oralis]